MVWNGEEALQSYAGATGATVFTRVPVTGRQRWGWGDDTRNRFEAIAVEGTRPKRGRETIGDVRPFDELEYRRALDSATAVRPIVAVGHADRPVYGHLATRKAFVERAWTPFAPVLPVALVAPGKEGHNVKDAYVAAGFEIRVVGGEATSSSHRGGCSPATNDPWDNPIKCEDRLLHALWNERERSGWWAAEVPVGFRSRPNEGSARRIDAVVVHTADQRHSGANQDHADLANAVRTGHVELIEAKRALTSNVIGQLLCGAAMFAASYPGDARVSLTACVAKNGDEALRWFCGRFGVAVAVVAPAQAA